MIKLINGVDSKSYKLRHFTTQLVRLFSNFYNPEVLEWCQIVEDFYDEIGKYKLEKLKELAGTNEIIEFEAPFHFIRTAANIAAQTVYQGVIVDLKGKVEEKEIETRAKELFQHIFSPTVVVPYEPNEDCISMANVLYQSQDISAVLADAIEDCGGDSSHFRTCLYHPKGCPHLDYARGKK